MLTMPQFWSQQRQELAQWLRERAPSFELGYVGAVRLLHMPQFPGRVHFVCHAVRDIYRNLPAALGLNSLQRPGEVFPNMVKCLADAWEKHPPRSQAKNSVPTTDCLVSIQVYRHTEAIVARQKVMIEQSSVGQQLAVTLFRAADRPVDVFVPRWITDSFEREYDFFVKRAHLAKSMDRVPTDDGLVEHFEAFERAFHSLIGPYFTGKSELDAILQDTNATTD